MSGFSDAIDGLMTRLQAGITDLQVFPSPPDSINTFPSVVAMINEVDYEIVYASDTIVVNVPVLLLAASGDNAQGYALLYDHIDPTETNMSFKAAVEADKTLGGNVDSSEVKICRGIGRRNDFGGAYYGAEFVVEFIKTI